LGGQGLRLEVTDAALAWLCEHGYDESCGARPLRRLIEQTIQDEIAARLLRGAARAANKSLSTALLVLWPLASHEAGTAMIKNYQTGSLIAERWEVHKVLGGGMGVVYIVYDQTLKEPFALKTYRDEVFQRAQRPPTVSIRRR